MNYKKSSFNFRIKRSIQSKPSQQLSSLQTSPVPLLTCTSFTPKQRTIKAITQREEPKQDIIKEIPPTEKPKQTLNRQPSYNLKRASILSHITTDSAVSQEEEYDLWNMSQDLRVQKLTIEEKRPSIGQFLCLYKARYSGFPGQPQQIKNEEVIKAAITHASSNKKLFKKYFPTKQIVFEDDHDYSKPYNIEEDQDFKKFNNFFHKQQKPLTITKLPKIE